MMNIVNLSEGMRDLLFGVRVSIRYHDRRRHFFVTLHRVTVGFGAVFGAAALASLLGLVDQVLGLTAAALVTSMSVIDLVIGLSESANLHRDLQRKFTELEERITGSHEEPRVGDFQRQRLKIEKDEPPLRWALCTLVQNEQTLAEFKPDEAARHLVPVVWWRRFSAHLLAHENHRLHDGPLV